MFSVSNITPSSSYGTEQISLNAAIIEAPSLLILLPRKSISYVGRAANFSYAYMSAPPFR